MSMLPKFNNNNNIFKKRNITKAPLKSLSDLSSIMPKDDKTKIRFTDNSLKSHNIAELKFTNYLESKNCNEYKILKQIYSDWKNRKDILEKHFNMNEEDGIGSEQDKKQRLFKVISHSEKGDITMESIQNMSKCRYNYSRKCNFPLRIYVKKRDEFVYIYFIDIYHLAWTDKKNNDPTTLYNEHKLKKICLSNLNEHKQQSQK